jgi:FkbH-like protein
VIENIRLVIWDLDETFWKGTLTEGGITYIEQNHAIVIELARRGIISSICSRNDLSAVRSVLEGAELWSYFVFPSINWEPKGPRIAALIENMMLRPATVMFIDDNPMNLNEVKHCAPDVQIADPSILANLLENPRFKGKKDPGLTRLGQYQLLQKRHEDEQSANERGTTNYEFLRSCDVRVRIEFDIKKHIDRAVELVNRTNQLNFTKLRLPEDPDLARAELLSLTASYNVQAGLVHVADRYGDYGFVGFYAIKTVGSRSDLVHYCFSCRTLGMGVETWVYRNIGRPWLPMTGEVLSDPRDESLPVDWVSIATPSQDVTGKPGSGETRRFEKLILRGGCAGLSIAHYFHATTRSVICEVTSARDGMPIRLDHSLFLTHALNGLTDEIIDVVERLGYQQSDFVTRLFERDVEDPIVILDFWTDADVAIYRHRELDFRVPFAVPYHLPIKPDGNAMELPSGFSAKGFDAQHLLYSALRTLREEFQYEGLIGESLFKTNLRRILNNIAPGARVFILAANETWLNPGNGLTYNYPAHTSLNTWTADVARDFHNVSILNVRQFLLSESEAETVNHFDRLVYFRIHQEVASRAVGVGSKTRCEHGPPAPDEAAPLRDGMLIPAESEDMLAPSHVP